MVYRQAQLEQVSRERSERLRLERDLEEASRRLAMAHQDIRRLTSELDAAKDNNQSSSGMEMTPFKSIYANKEGNIKAPHIFLK